MKAKESMRRFLGVLDREKDHLRDELSRTQKMMPLLMKARNGEKWTPQEKEELAGHVRRLSKMSPYIALIVIPGGFALLPLLAWWLDRRRARRKARKD
jgi:hypothetical protein